MALQNLQKRTQQAQKGSDQRWIMASSAKIKTVKTEKDNLRR
jgi:hypothetical protein